MEFADAHTNREQGLMDKAKEHLIKAHNLAPGRF